MSGCYAIAFVIIFALRFKRTIWGSEIISGNKYSDWLNLGILVVLILVFVLRRYHYRARRIELIDRYYKAYCEKEANKDQEKTV